MAKTEKKPLTVGERIRAERHRRKLSQMDLAVLVESMPAEISRLEKGRREVSKEMGRKICAAFAWDWKDLFGEVEAKETK